MSSIALWPRRWGNSFQRPASSYAFFERFLFYFIEIVSRYLLWHQAVKPFLVLIGTCLWEWNWLEKLSSSVWFDEWQSKDGGECLACKQVLKWESNSWRRFARLESTSEHLTAESSLLLLHNHSTNKFPGKCSIQYLNIYKSKLKISSVDKSTMKHIVPPSMCLMFDMWWIIYSAYMQHLFYF